MDLASLKDFIGWIIAGVLINLAALASSIFVTVRGIVLLKREAKSTDIKNKKDELDYTKQIELAANEAATKTLNLNQELIALKIDMQSMKATQIENDVWKKKAEGIMTSQAKRITFLECEVSNYKILTSEHTKQLEGAGIVPVRMEDLELEDCSKLNGK